MRTTGLVGGPPSAPVPVASAWAELVTTALLGTDRRPVPTGLTGAVGGSLAPEPAHPADPTDPATLVLQLAARHRAAAQAGVPLQACDPPPRGPVERTPLAPFAAQQLLSSLLLRPDPVLVNAWLAACHGRRLGVTPDLWPRLASLAARSSGYDRALLVQVLGPRGRWFLQQHPQWTRLVETGTTSGAGPLTGDPAAAIAAVSQGLSVPEAVDLILGCPDPWPPALSRSAVELVAGGLPGVATRSVAAQIGARLPLDQATTSEPWWATLSAAEHAGVGSTPTAALLGLELVRRTVQSRIEIDQTFRVVADVDRQAQREAQP
jgi:hypothetical protein